MYLKRLDVQGFKSFANKTPLQFGSGVTCVVGPNGTGKTNVADSLRWVLGEHASRTLRARKTEDVIFAGSDKRAPMGVAEVSITLDNSGQWLPIEFDEVVVTRRAYRSGENEYLINNSKVRLKDVIDLFLRAQVGQNSYAFMGQGMVEQVLSLRPEDRRGLIEEAAEVRLYRNKLEDAQHKLKATRDNMDRVRLLVREIEPRITQLERQAGRAVKYQELTRELASTLHVWYAQQWQDVNDVLLAAITTHDQRIEEFDVVRADAKACEDGLVQLRAAIDERRREIGIREERCAKLQAYVGDLERRAALDGERGRLLGERIEEFTAELASLRADEAAQDVAASGTDTSALEARLDSERGDLAAQRARLAVIEKDLIALQRSALTDEQAAARALASVEDLSPRIIEATDTIARLRRERDVSADERRKIISELAVWAREYARVSKEAALISPRLTWAVNDRDRETAAALEHRSRQAALDDELRALRSELESVQTRLDMMETIDTHPQAPDAGIRVILEAGGVIKRESVPRDVELGGVFGLVGQILRVPPGYEKAIEAALAENLFAVVFERETQMRRAVDLLLGGDGGRAMMYALDSFHETRPLHLIKERGIVGVASALVKCDSKYRRLVDTLLGRTVVVDNLEVARRVVRRGLAGAVVTLDGVLLRPVGSMAAGSLATVQASFARVRDLQDLPEELVRLTPLVEEKESAAADAARRQAESERHALELTASVDQLREQKSGIDAELSASRALLGDFRTRLRANATAVTQRSDQIDALHAKRQEAEQQREARIAEAREAAAREREARASISALDAERSSLGETIAERAAVVAQVDGQFRSERQIGDGERLTRERLARQIATKDGQQAKSQQEAQTVASRLAATERELAEKAEEVAALLQELEPARQERAQFESRERALAAQLGESNEKLRSAERALVDAENDARGRREELENLRISLETEGFIATDKDEIERAPEPERAITNELPAEAYVSTTGLPTWLRSEENGLDPDLPPVRGGATINPTEMRDRIADLRVQIRSLGPVNEEAATEYAASRERYDFLTGQLQDLGDAENQLTDAIGEMETVIRERFRATFKTVNHEFERYFSAFFRGGTARLELGEPDENGLPGIEIVAQPPGKKLGSLALLSGGERSLTAVALLFALLEANPSPICVLDEVDAALDEANVGRFVEELRALSERTQFIIITHNRRTIETADTIYGVSMGADNVSRVLSLRLADVEADLD
ncbi:MAG: chromosome segregation protein SMC [Chloroflexota bacterium]|nr:chromosome segregation protein SMC [Chloroflexota bacterium]